MCPSSGVWLYLWLFGVQKYILTNAGVIHEGIEGFYFDHRQLHDRVYGSSKIRNSVDNNLLLKIRFRQKSVTFSAVNINRKSWPKRRLRNWYGNTNRGIRKNWRRRPFIYWILTVVTEAYQRQCYGTQRPWTCLWKNAGYWNDSRL